MTAPEFGQVMSLEERLEMAELMITRIVASLERIEREMDVLVNYARTSAQLQGLIERAKTEFSQLDSQWQEIVDERRSG